jgi:hypothetical protein
LKAEGQGGRGAGEKFEILTQNSVRAGFVVKSSVVNTNLFAKPAPTT